MSALEDPDTQINGVVMIPWGLPKQSPWQAWKANNLMSVLPYQTKGWHTVLAEIHSPWLSWLSSILDKKSRMRMRMHNGTHQEIMYTVRAKYAPMNVVIIFGSHSLSPTHLFHLPFCTARTANDLWDPNESHSGPSGWKCRSESSSSMDSSPKRFGSSSATVATT
jgi:hypothetical protein